MNIKRLAKRWIPPILVDWYRAFRYGGSYQKHIWDGIYQNFKDVPTLNTGYAGNRLTQETLAYTRKVLLDSQKHKFVLGKTSEEHSFLPLLVAILSCYRDSVSILDFGGGMGVDYIHLANSIPTAKNIYYHIVENRLMCEAGSDLFKNDSHIRFYPTLPAPLPKVDIIYMCSALQYVEDYDSLLRDLAQYRPEYFLFAKLSSGNIPTYATSQRNLPGTIVAYWFINIQEIESIMVSSGYSLVFKSILQREYDQSNFPTEYRLGRACNLLFKRSTLNE